MLKHTLHLAVFWLIVLFNYTAIRFKTYQMGVEWVAWGNITARVGTGVWVGVGGMGKETNAPPPPPPMKLCIVYMQKQHQVQK